MKLARTALTLAALGLVATALPARAETGIYGKQEVADAACGAGFVVWVNLDRGRYYHKDQPEYAKGNGVYACEQLAHARYRQAKPSNEAYASK